jgi:hypothetical protein
MNETESTRIVGPQPVGLPVADGDAEVFQVLPGDIVKGVGRPSEAQRLVNELRYLEYFAQEIGEVLSGGSLEVLALEDGNTQSGFRRVTGNGSETIYYGVSRLGRRRLSQLRRELGKKD